MKPTRHVQRKGKSDYHKRDWRVDPTRPLNTEAPKPAKPKRTYYKPAVER